MTEQALLTTVIAPAHPHTNTPHFLWQGSPCWLEIHYVADDLELIFLSSRSEVLRSWGCASIPDLFLLDGN